MTTPEERLRSLGELTRGFLYCFAVRGTTGLRESLAGEVGPFMQRSRACCSVPLALGLGISNPEQCRQAAELADGVVVGSALVKAAMDAMEDGEDPAPRAGELAAHLKSARGWSQVTRIALTLRQWCKEGVITAAKYR